MRALLFIMLLTVTIMSGQSFAQNDYKKNHPGSVQAISMDKDVDRFKAFTKQFPDSSIDPLIWDTEFHLGLSLETLGVSFSGFIPFVALIDKDGKTITQGHITVDEIKEFLEG